MIIHTIPSLTIPIYCYSVQRHKYSSMSKTDPFKLFVFGDYVGLSVSRVGSVAQLKSMKQVCGSLKLELNNNTYRSYSSHTTNNPNKEKEGFIHHLKKNFSLLNTDFLVQPVSKLLNYIHGLLILYIIGMNHIIALNFFINWGLPQSVELGWGGIQLGPVKEILIKVEQHSPNLFIMSILLLLFYDLISFCVIMISNRILKNINHLISYVCTLLIIRFSTFLFIYLTGHFLFFLLVIFNNYNLVVNEFILNKYSVGIYPILPPEK